MESGHNQSRLLYGIAGLTLLLFLCGRIVASHPFDNNWAFTHWRYLPLSYVLLWGVATATVAAALMFVSRRRPRWLESPVSGWMGLASVAALLWPARFDSFALGAGNLRVAQIAQADTIVARWFEYGSITVLSWLFNFFRWYGLKELDAGAFAWRMWAFFWAIAALLGTAKLASKVTQDRNSRLFIFLVLLGGGPVLLLLGFVGIEPLIPAVTVWFFVAAIELSRSFSLTKLPLLWLIQGLGILMYFNLVYLVPATLYLTVATPSKQRRAHISGLVLAILALVGLMAAVYHFGSRSFPFSEYLLFPRGKPPLSNYGIFSAKHIGDWFSVIYLAMPLVVVTAGLAFVRSVSKEWSQIATAAGVASVGGLAAILIIDPRNGVALDFPILSGYLAPFPILLITLMARRGLIGDSVRHFLPIVAAMALMFPLATLSNYTRIFQTEPYISDYLDKNETYYRTACLSFRDAHFNRREFKLADEWWFKLPIKSQDFLDFRGTADLVFNSENADALRVLPRIITRLPYWTEPRTLMAVVQMKLGHFGLAKPQIDTCLILEPYKIDHWRNLFNYYRGSGNYPAALETVNRTLELAPHRLDVKTDLMAISYQMGKTTTADSLATALMAADSTKPYPYLVKGTLADEARERDKAIGYYRRFLALSKEEADAPRVRARLQELGVPVDSAK